MMVLFWLFIGLMTLVALLVLILPMRSKQKSLSVFLLLVLPAVALTLYWHLGSSQKLQHYWVLKREAKDVKTALLKIKNPQQVVVQLRTYLKVHPNSPKGWYLLGKLYFGERRYSDALSASQKAHLQEPANIPYSVAYAQASFFQNRRRLTPKVLVLLKGIVRKNPRNVPAMNLLAIHYYLRKEYKSAVQYWEKLLPLFPVGGSDQKVLLSMIAKAQRAES